MQAVFTKVISFILSILMPVTGLFAGGTPVSSSDIFILEGWSLAEDVYSIEEKIITTHEDFETSFGAIAENYSFFKSIDESYFENGNLAVINVVLADTAETVVVKSAAEKGDTLKISYAIEDSGAFGATIICYNAICVKTSKNITQIEAVEKDGFSSFYRSFMSKLIEFVR